MKKRLFAIIAVLFVSFQASASSEFPTFEFEEDFTLPIVYLNIVVDVGGVHDPKEEIGLANIANHMLLRGTQKHSKTEFFELVNRLGGEFDVDVAEEGTVFRGAVLAENLEPFLALIDEALTKPKFTSGELAKLKKETEGAILERKGNDKSLVMLHFYRFLYGSHPYGNPTIGTIKGVRSITNKDVLGFYARNFNARTMRLFGTGAAKKDVLDKWFTTLTERLTALHPEAKPQPMVAKPELAKGKRALLVDKPKATQTQVLMGATGMRPETPGFYAITLGNYPFGGGSFQARLMQEIRVKRGWTYGASNAFRYGSQPRHFAMYVFPKTEDTVPAIELSLKLFDDWVKKGITEDEYRFARDSLVNNAPFNYDTSKKRLSNLTTEYMLRFPRGFYRDFANNIAKVKYGDVAPALIGFFNPENMALTVVGDAQKLKEPMSKLPGFGAPEVRSYLED